MACIRRRIDFSLALALARALTPSEIARGSAVECAARLDVLVVKHRLTVADVEPGKKQLYAIVSMLCGLIEAVANRVREKNPLYQIEQEQE